jgi:ABC-type polysaccharide/polyol phosphate transport system ATPase subunit
VADLGVSAPAVVVDGVQKRFRIPQERVDTLKERALHPWRRARYDRFEALRDITFTVGQGEFFGIVGRNGSGKSTLLKCLAGIYSTDGGEIWVDGRMSTFIELGVGFNPDLALHDNAVLNAVMMGLSRKEAEARVPAIVEFAELEEFVDLKFKNYSSGMMVRLAFSVMLQVEADIMLIDEVLAVGDAAFQQKCFDQFNRMRDEGRTILFVTHDMGSVERYCHRAMLLERGEIVTIGEPREVGARYLDLNFSRRRRSRGAAAAAPADSERDPARPGDQTAEILDVWCEDASLERSGVLPQHEPCTLKMLLRFEETTQDPVFAFTVLGDRGQRIFTVTSEDEDESEGSGTFDADELVVFAVNFDNILAPGRFHVSASVAHPKGGFLDLRERAETFLCRGRSGANAIVHPRNQVGIHRISGAVASAPPEPSA